MPGADGLEQGAVPLPEPEAVADPHPQSEMVVDDELLVGRAQQVVERLHGERLEAVGDGGIQGRRVVLRAGHRRKASGLPLVETLSNERRAKISSKKIGRVFR